MLLLPKVSLPNERLPAAPDFSRFVPLRWGVSGDFAHPLRDVNRASIEVSNGNRKRLRKHNAL